MKFSKREYILIFITAAVVVFYLFFAFLLSPQLDRNQKLEEKVFAQSIELRTLQAKVKILSALEKVKREGKFSLGGMSDFLNFIAEDAALSGVDINSITPGVSQTGEAVQQNTIEVQLKGGYLGLLDFLAAFEKGTTAVPPAAAANINIVSGEENKPLNITVMFDAAFN